MGACSILKLAPILSTMIGIVLVKEHLCRTTAQLNKHRVKLLTELEVLFMSIGEGLVRDWICRRLCRLEELVVQGVDGEEVRLELLAP